ncbi:MAG: DUF3788 domain-containing protein [Dysgonamonadaceae bacterium]|jgi:hypothetical protein|nr:DUF3788 domain-containing protein [Dysgonamonadaceae bacterium]
MEVQLLREQNIFPSEEVLKNVLGQVYALWAEFETQIIQGEFALTPEWNYYNDGKSWLCKVCHKKKTVFWLSVWEGHFRITFFFTEKHLEGISELNISEQIKEDFCRMKPIGKLLPMMINIDKQSQLADVLKIVKFKKEWK